MNTNQPSLILKRQFDLLGAIGGLLLLSPLLPLIALAIKLDSPGPVLYRQQRVGGYTSKGVVLFDMIKFRSMRTDAEKSGAVWAQQADPRITRVGRILRKYRLDEIPQLYNVIKGDMSLIGPRPERPCFYRGLEQQIPYYADRTYGLRPGITGLAQVYQGYDTSVEDVRSKVAYDHSYRLLTDNVTNWLLTDLRIIGLTLWVMLRGRGQ